MDDGINLSMPVAPAYAGGYGMNNGGFGGGFGGDWGWIILILLLAGNGGWGNGFGGGFGGGNYDFPWILNGQTNLSEHMSDGFRDAQLHDSVTSVRDGVSNLATQLCNCCGDMQLGMANGFNGVNNSIFGAQTALSQQLNTNEIASLNRSFAEQTANMQGFNGVQAGIADTKYTIATEECATRSASAMNTRDIIDSQTRGTQAILDKLCALELDGVKAQLAQAQRENVGLQNAVNMATMQASQVQQTSDIINGTYTRLAQCPVNSTPVYGNQPIFTCPNSNSGCGCGGFAN
jgi:hypothetical protein